MTTATPPQHDPSPGARAETQAPCPATAADPPPLHTATREELHQLDPGRYSPALRAALVERALKVGRGHFAMAKAEAKAGKLAAAETETAEGRAWMRERRRWLPEQDAAAAPRPRRRRDRRAPTSTPHA